MDTLQGRIIAILGAPAAGKSYLIRRLRAEYPVESIMEGEEDDLPAYVKRNLKENINGLQTNLFFHTLCIGQYLESVKLRDEGKLVLLDAMWFSNFFYLAEQLPDPDDLKLMRELIRLTIPTLSSPDTIVYLRCPDAVIRQRLIGRNRSFEQNFLDFAFAVNREHEAFFSSPQAKEFFPQTTIVTINSAEYELASVARLLALDRKEGAAQMAIPRSAVREVSSK